MNEGWWYSTWNNMYTIGLTIIWQSSGQERLRFKSSPTTFANHNFRDSHFWCYGCPGHRHKGFVCRWPEPISRTEFVHIGQKAYPAIYIECPSCSEIIPHSCLGILYVNIKISKHRYVYPRKTTGRTTVASQQKTLENGRQMRCYSRETW